MKHKILPLLFTIVLSFCTFVLKAQSTVPVTLKVIDKTKGVITGDTKKVFGWVGMWSPSNATYQNTGSWYANFFDGYTNGNLVKSSTEWTWSFTFNAPKGGSFGWDPCIGSPEGSSISIKSHYELVEDSNADIDFFVSSSGQITGGVSITFHTNHVTINDINGNAIVQKSFEPEDDSDNNFLHASGKWIFDGDGNRFTIRAIGLGNYMLLEPYMIGIVNSAQTLRSDSHQAIMGSFTELAGEQNVQTFMDTYLDNYFTEDDVIYLKEIGFNAIRMSLHHKLFIREAGNNNAFIEKGFEYVQRVLNWCEEHEIYLILDMHCAPGGQSEDVWSVSDAYGPGLFEGDAHGTARQYQEKYAVLWGELARRFGNSPWIGGYDLTNEINYKAFEAVGQQKIKALYEQLIDSVRSHDKKHILFVQGNFYGNRYEGLTPPWDDNMVYCFHHYWSPNTNASIQRLLTLRDQHNVPVWMGEGGENSNVWFTDAIELLENNNIGWAWWSYKKMDDISGILSVPRPQNWDQILRYLRSSNNTSNLTQEQAKNILMEFAEKTKLANAKKNIDVIYSILEQPFNNNTKPFGENKVPGKIFATEYDMGRNEHAYFEKGLLGQEEIDQGAYNNGWTGRNDPVDIEKKSTLGGNGFVISYTERDEWLNYTVYSESAARYNLKLNYSVSDGNGNITIKVNGINAISNFAMANTGSWNTYQTINMGEITLREGWNTVQVYFNAGCNLSHLTFDYNASSSINKNTGINENYNVIFTPNAFACTVPEYADKIYFEMFDLSGKKIFQQTKNSVSAGIYRFHFTGNRIEKGVYLNKITVEKGERVIFSKTERNIMM